MNSILLRFCLFFAVAAFPFSGNTQILAPDFQCVVNDSLFWEPAINTCGPFEAYEIFGSTQVDGPYSLLTTITDPAQTVYFHSTANNQLWYYYLTSPHNCPGASLMTSDTLDNLIPLVGPVEYVTVINGEVEISWGPSPSPETIAYIISRNTVMGTTILDTVYNGTTYLDVTAAPDLQSEVYFVVALDACGNKSLVPPPHQTILMGFTPPDACNIGLAINWSAYQNWGNGVDRYEIFVGADGALPTLAGTVTGTQTNFVYEGGNDGEELCFFVEAVEAATDFRSRSNVHCTTVSILQPIREIDLLGASVNADGSVSLEWLWDPTALLTEAFQESARVNDDNIVATTLPLSSPLVNDNFQQDIIANAQNAAYFYRISATDECGNTIVSNQSTTPFLRGEALANGNRLRWDAYLHDLATEVSYELVKIAGTLETTVFTGNSTDLEYLDPVDPQLETEGSCYFLRVNVTYLLSTGEELSRVVTSNTVCLIPAPKVYVPNIFAPEGVNSTFRPQLSFGTLAEYEMLIYDRWGGQVFQSNSIEKGWDGDRQGALMPQGIYLYFIRLTPNGGTPIELSGDVMLLR
jgi:gliding motility-associated-like protein